MELSNSKSNKSCQRASMNQKDQSQQEQQQQQQVPQTPKCVHHYQRAHHSKYQMQRNYLSTSESSLSTISSTASPCSNKRNFPELSPMSKRRNWKFYAKPNNPYDELKRNLYSDSRSSSIKRGSVGLGGIRPGAPYHSFHSSTERKTSLNSSSSSSTTSTSGALNSSATSIMDKFSKIKLSD